MHWTWAHFKPILPCTRCLVCLHPTAPCCRQRALADHPGARPPARAGGGGGGRRGGGAALAFIDAEAQLSGDEVGEGEEGEGEDEYDSSFVTDGEGDGGDADSDASGRWVGGCTHTA